VAFTLPIATPHVTFASQALDAAGAPDPNAKIAYAIDDATIVSIVDNGDGTGAATALKAGTATLTATATDPDGHSISGIAAITVTDTDVASLNITFGTPTA
jgi:uncharacterized protein YjdB